jgi:hypothetical protein
MDLTESRWLTSIMEGDTKRDPTGILLEARMRTTGRQIPMVAFRLVGLPGRLLLAIHSLTNIEQE